MGLLDLFKKKQPAAPQRPAPRPMPRLGGGLPPHPDPLAKNNFIIVILDSCRYDSFMAAAPRARCSLLPAALKSRPNSPS